MKPNNKNWREEFENLSNKEDWDLYTYQEKGVKVFIQTLLDNQKKATLEMIDDMMVTKEQGYYCTLEHLGYHDKNCEGCDRNNLLKELKERLK